MARPFHYHVHHRAAFDALPPLASTTINVPRLSGAGTEAKQVYSLKKDMEKLRADGAAKGIVDASVIDVGESWGGRKLWALKVGKGSSHKVLFTGCHHAREWVSVEVPYLVAEYLIENYKASPSNDTEKRVKHLLTNREIWFVPMVNPDGHQFTTITNRLWRANRKTYAMRRTTITAPQKGGGSRRIRVPAGSYTGVDVNRNYDTGTWGQETLRGRALTTSRDPRDGGENSIWCGPSGSSEKETKAIDDLFIKHKFRASVTYHNFSQLLLFPDDAASDKFVQDVGKGMATLINQHGNPYTYQSGSALYETTGDLMDFSFEKAPGRPTFTPELRPKDTAPSAHFFSGLPESEIEPCFKENLESALALINCAGHNTAPNPFRVTTKATFPFRTITVVDNCWSVFLKVRGWTP